jgi:TRAP transporter TAXI family solute receptor
MFRWRRRRVRLVAVVTASVLIALAIGVTVANRFAGPLPPRRLVMSTGREGGAYFEYALQYRQVLARQGFSLDVVPGAGSVETIDRLRAGSADVGFVQGGVVRAMDTTGLTALGGVFDEPVWVFFRRPLAFGALTELRGRRVAVGEPGSGTRLLALQLLQDTGVTPDNTTLRELSIGDTETGLHDGTLDAAFLVASTRAPVVHRLLEAPAIGLLSERRALAYRARHPFLSSLTIGEGMIDMARNIPPEDKTLLAARASLVVRAGIHPDLVRLLLFAADRVHATAAGEQATRFPSAASVELPLHEQAARYLRSGPSWLERTFPFWMAGILDRLLLIMLPVVTLLPPLLGFLFPMFERRKRTRIARFYGTLRAIEQRCATADAATLDAEIARLREVRRQAAGLRDTPVLHLAELYQLLLHVDRTLERLDQRRGAPEEALDVGPTPARR